MTTSTSSQFRFLTLTLLLIASFVVSPSAEARRRKKSSAPIPFAEKGIGGIELGDADSAQRILGSKRWTELWGNQKDQIMKSGLGVNSLHDNEIVVLRSHSKDEPGAFSEVQIVQESLLEEKPVMTTPLTFAAYTDHGLRIGVSKDEVHKIFGKPIEKQTNGEIETWMFRQKASQDRTQFVNENQRSGYFREFKFKDGKAVSVRFGFID